MRSVILLKSSSTPENGSNLTDAYVTELNDKFIPLLVNTLSFTFFALDELWNVLKHPSNYSGIIFTSPRAVEAVEKAITQFGSDEWQNSYLPIWKTKKIYCVGEATERNVQNGLQLPGEGGGTGNAATLASYIIDTFSREESLPLLFPSGELRREELPEILRNARIPFSPLTVYNTTSSPSLKSELEDCFRKVFIAIGPTTEKALKTAEMPVYKVCDKPTPVALRHLLEEDISG